MSLDLRVQRTGPHAQLRGVGGRRLSEGGQRGKPVIGAELPQLQGIEEEGVEPRQRLFKAGPD